MNEIRPGSARVQMGSRGALAIAVIVLTTVVCTVAFRGLTIDDAFIAFRFAHHARLGLGFVWNPGEAPVEGMTSLLWTALLVPFARDKHALYGWAKALGVLANAGTLLLWIRLLRERFGPRSSRYALWLLAACCPLLAFHSLNGLETALAVLCASSMLSAALTLVSRRDDTRARFVRSAILFGVLWLVGGATRPELVPYGLCLIAVGAWELERRRRALLARCLAAAFLLPGAAYFLLRWHYFGQLLPLPFYAKHASGIVSSAGAKYVVLTFLGLIGGATLLGLLGSSRRFGTLLPAGTARMLLWPSLLLCVSYAAFRPIMGFVYRFPTPFLLPLVAAASGTIAHALDGRSSGVWARRIVYALGVLSLVQLASVSVPAWHFATINSQATRAFHQRFGEVLAGLPETGRLTAFNDVGGPAFFSGWPATEGAGLVTPSVSIGGASNRELVSSFDPDVIVLSSDARRIESAAAEFPNYRLLRAVPWLVFAGDGPKSYQCVLARSDYAHLAELREQLGGLGLPELPQPWYFALYRRIKRSLG